MADDKVAQPTGDESHIRQDEGVDEVGRESFPASDPPSSWSGEDPRDMDGQGSETSRASG
jgi:hypothetical protein